MKKPDIEVIKIIELSKVISYFRSLGFTKAIQAEKSFYDGGENGSISYAEWKEAVASPDSYEDCFVEFSKKMIEHFGEDVNIEISW